MLEVNDLHAWYGKSHVLQGVSFEVAEGEIVSLLGRNGVGRSTTVKTIMGEVEPQGSILLRNEQIAGRKQTGKGHPFHTQKGTDGGARRCWM